MSGLLDKICSRGHWRVVIRPSKFCQRRIPDIAALYPLLQKSVVSLRGWDFPQLEPLTNLHIDIDWVGQESEWDYFLEVWRFYQSGQFIHIAGMRNDWHDQSGLSPTRSGWQPGTLLGVQDTLFRFTEIFEFAARLALTEAGDEQMCIEITLRGLQGRALRLDSPSRLPFVHEYRASIKEFPLTMELPRSTLIADTRELAVQHASELFRRFGWDPPPDLLRSLQAELQR